MAEGSSGDQTKLCPYVLLELDSMENIYSPIRNSIRIKYTCFDVSRRFVVFGSTSGGIYFFLRDSLQFLKTITNKDGPVSQVALAPDDSIVAFSTSRGHVLVMEHNVDKENVQPHRLQFTYDHKGALVTCLHWSNTTARLYAGDDAGRVSLVNVSQSRTRSLFQVPSAILMKVDSRIVQLDFTKDQLLVSSLTRSYVYSTNTEQWVQIGKKLREGDYGACLYPGPRYQDPCTIFSARPGARLWEADLRGNVLSTHQFKQALNIPPAKIITYKSDLEVSSSCHQASSTVDSVNCGFSKLHNLWPSSEALPFLLTWNQHGIYILNPKKVEVTMRSEVVTGVKCSKSYKSEIYINYQSDKFSRFTFLTLERAMTRLYQRQLNVQCARLMLQHPQILATSSSPTPALLEILEDLTRRLNIAGHSHLADLLMPLKNSVQVLDVPKEPHRHSLPLGKSPRRARSALAHREPCHSRRTSPKPTRCRSASPLLRQRRSSGSPTQQSPNTSLKGEKGLMVRSLEETILPLPSVLKPESRSPLMETKSHHKLPERSIDVFKPLPLQLNGLLSPVEEGRTENSPITNVPSYSKPNSAPSQICPVQEEKKITSISNGHAHQFEEEPSQTLALTEPEPASNNLGLNFDMSFRLMSLSVHGGGMIFPPGFDYSHLGPQDPSDLSSIDLGKLKDSIATTLTSGKKVFMQNLKGLETKFKQFQDGSSPTSRSQSPVGFLEDQRSPQTPEKTYWAKTSMIDHNALHDSGFWDNVPSVDLTPLLEATSQAQIRLRDPDILLDPTGRQEVLENWATVLNRTQKKILQIVKDEYSNREPCDNDFEDSNLEVNGNTIRQTNFDKCQNFTSNSSKRLTSSLRESPVIVYCPFRISPEIHAQLSALAIGCFRTKFLGRSLIDLESFFTLKDPLDDALHYQLDRSDSLPKRDKNGNHQELDTFESSSTIDNSMSLFVRNYFHFLAFDSESREDLFVEWMTTGEDGLFTSSTEEVNLTRYQTWCALVKGIQLLNRKQRESPFVRALEIGNVTACAEDLLKTFRITRSTIANIVQLARLDYKKTLDACTKLCHQMSPVDILYISRCTKRHPNLFLNCVETLLEEISSKQRTKMLSRLFSSCEVRREWMRCVLEHHPPTSNGSPPLLKCPTCGCPTAGSHLYIWPFGKDLLHVIDIFGNSESENRIVLKLCHDKGFWPGYLLLLKKCKEREKHLEALYLLNDGRLLSESHPLGCLPEELPQWTFFLRKLVETDSSTSNSCLGCGNSSGIGASSGNLSNEQKLNLDCAARRMLLAFRPAEVLGVLRTLGAKSGAISSTTYRATILTHLIDAQQSILSHSMLARLESYLWSRRSTAIPPQIWKVLEEEKNSSNKSEISNKEKSPPAASPSVELRQRCLRYLEEPENHWGVTAQIQRSCPLCGIPLCSHLLSSHSVKVTGVTVGSCGHAFHSSCVGQTSAPCPICIDRPLPRKQ